MPLGIYPTVDYVFKRLFGDPANADLLIHLLNAVLKPAVPITAVHIENPILEKDFEDDKLAVLDIRATDERGNQFNVEMQTSVLASLPERLVYYTCHLYGAQLGAGETYANLQSAISICFLTRSLFADVKAPHLRFVLADSEHGVTLTHQFQVHTVELAKYNWDRIQLETADNLTKWACFFQNAPALEKSDLNRLLPDAPFIKATGILEMISLSPEQRHLHDARLRAQRDYLSGIEGAKREGREEGREEGVLIGVIQFLQETLNEPIAETHELASLGLDKLATLAAELQARFALRSRS